MRGPGSAVASCRFARHTENVVQIGDSFGNPPVHVRSPAVVHKLLEPNLVTLGDLVDTFQLDATCVPCPFPTVTARPPRLTHRHAGAERWKLCSPCASSRRWPFTSQSTTRMWICACDALPPLPVISPPSLSTRLVAFPAALFFLALMTRTAPLPQQLFRPATLDGPLELQRLSLDTGAAHAELHVVDEAEVGDAAGGTAAQDADEAWLSTGRPAIALDRCLITFARLSSLERSASMSEVSFSVEALPSPSVPEVDVFVNGARVAWDERTRDVAFNLADMFDQYRILQRHFRLDTVLSPRGGGSPASPGMEDLSARLLLSPTSPPPPHIVPPPSRLPPTSNPSVAAAAGAMPTATSRSGLDGSLLHGAAGHWSVSSCRQSPALNASSRLARRAVGPRVRHIGSPVATRHVRPARGRASGLCAPRHGVRPLLLLPQPAGARRLGSRRGARRDDYVRVGRRGPHWCVGRGRRCWSPVLCGC